MSRPENVVLIQVHYHNRVGGVSTVMQSYAHAFHLKTGKKALDDILVCHYEPSGTLAESTSLYDVPECDYAHFASREEFIAMRDSLQRMLGDLVKAHAEKARVVVIGHNLTLGKNCALSSAFYHCARACHALGNRVAYFSVVHDFAEEGRSDMMQRIRAVSCLYPEIRSEMYAEPKLIRFLSPSTRNVRLLQQAGLSATFLPNPVETGRNRSALSQSVYSHMKIALANHAIREGSSFMPDGQTFFYPARLIARKNIAEAILIACGIYDANLLLGAPGVSAADVAWADRLKEVSHACGFRVIFDAPSALRKVNNEMSPSKCFNLLYRFCDLCLSTSVAEGFGYALFEPWCYDKPLIGRFPSGANRSAGIDWSHMYKTLPVPTAWVDMESLRDDYRKSLRSYWGGKKDPGQQQWEEFWNKKRRTIDFGFLNTTEQVRVLKRVGQHRMEQEVRKWIDTLPEKALSFEMQPEQINNNRIAIRTTHSAELFATKFFRKVIKRSDCTKHDDDAIGHKAIASYFSSPRNFRRILTPRA